MKSHQPQALNGLYSEALRLMSLPNTLAAIILFFIACIMISMPEMTSNTRDFFMVAFACVALLPENIK
jgi:hypothetical protein